MVIAREHETRCLEELYASRKSEFVVLYGRRRVGKTFLVKEVFKGRFAFVHTGLANAGTREQLDNFCVSLLNAGMPQGSPLSDWYDGFNSLAGLLERMDDRKKVVFIDEMPWMDTPRSQFVSALEHFWNGFAALRDDILLVACGSATSWMINEVINNHGGLYCRVTSQMYLRPFTLGECEQLCLSQGLAFSRTDMLHGYMALGGIPYYWTLLRRGRSLAQNIDALCFTRGGELTTEFDKLFASLFRRPEPYTDIIVTLASQRRGMNRDEIARATGLSDGGKLTRYLSELEQCDFLRRYNVFGRKSKGAVYQLVDGFTLFHHTFMRSHTPSDGPLWMKMQGRPRHNAWTGLAFERVCLLHVQQIIRSLGISGILTTVQAWQAPKGTPPGQGAQIDLLIDRVDNAVTICEMKYSQGLYSIDRSDWLSMTNKMDAFRTATGTRKSLLLTMVTTNGVRQGQYSHIVQSEVTLNDLFA